MNTKLCILTVLIATLAVGCKSAPETRRTVSASGDPEDLFFEKSMDYEDKTVAISVEEDLKPDSVARYDVPEKKPNTSGSFDEIGYSSWYGSKYQGKPTASGEPFDSGKLTAAHRTLPMGSIVRVQNLENKKEAMVRVNDRGPFVEGRVIDVSEKAADILDFKDKGIAKVGLSVVNKGGNQKFEELDDGDLDEDMGLLDKPEKLIPKKEGNPSPGGSSVSANRPRGFTVQVGLFRESSRAENYKNLMEKEYGKKVFVYKRSDGHVVQVGDFTSRDQAERFKSKLRYDGIECFIPSK